MEMWNWIKLHWAEIFAALFGLYYALKPFTKLTKTTADDSALAKFGSFLGAVARLIRFDPPPDPFEAKPITAAQVKDLTQSTLNDLGRAKYADLAVDFRRDADDARRIRRRSILLAVIRGIAEARGGKLTDAQVGDVLTDIIAEAGPVQSLLAWIVAHPEVVWAIIKAILAMAASKQNAGDVSV